MSKYKYFIVYKPFDVLSQFTEEAGHKALGSLHHFPKDVYPVGRLDHDSEGLLILTNDTRLNNFLLNPAKKKPKTYWAEVEGTATEEAMKKLVTGIEINTKGKKHLCKAVSVNIIKPEIFERDPPVNYKKHPERCWLEIKITEGKNRQIRKMTAAIGHPTLRLVRAAIDDLKIETFEAGYVKELTAEQLFPLIHFT